MPQPETASATNERDLIATQVAEVHGRSKHAEIILAGNNAEASQAILGSIRTGLEKLAATLIIEQATPPANDAKADLKELARKFIEGIDDLKRMGQDLALEGIPVEVVTVKTKEIRKATGALLEGLSVLEAQINSLERSAAA